MTSRRDFDDDKPLFFAAFFGDRDAALVLAVISCVGWASSVAFAGVSGPTAVVTPIAVRSADVEQSDFPYENGVTYDLNQLTGNPPTA